MKGNVIWTESKGWLQRMFGKWESVTDRSLRGIHSCPKCGSKETWRNVIATSERWLWHYCDNCHHSFRKSAANEGGLNRALRGLSKIL